jgi:C4-type Zn-finger protein
MPKTINLKVDSYEELRDALPTSGLFDIFDCNVELQCSPTAPSSEIDKMFGIIRSTINIVKTRVTDTYDEDEEKLEEYFLYNFKISEVPYRNNQGRFQR